MKKLGFRYFLAQDIQSWLRPLLFIVQLLVIAGLAFRASERQLALILFLLLGVGLVMTFLRWPPLGLIFASLAGMVVRFLGPSGLNVTMIFVALLFCLWLLDMLVRQRQTRFAHSRSVWTLLSFLGISFLSFGIGQFPWFPFAIHAPFGAQVGGLSIVVLSVGTFLLVANQVHDLGWLSKMTWAFLAFAALSVVFRSVLPEFGISRSEFFSADGQCFLYLAGGVGFQPGCFQSRFTSRLAVGARWSGIGHDLYSHRFEIS